MEPEITVEASLRTLTESLGTERESRAEGLSEAAEDRAGFLRTWSDPPEFPPERQEARPLR